MANKLTENPFTIVKASDYSDVEISDYWVDIPGGDGFYSILKPLSKMPMLILGGKGSGKTHLMRYFSYHLQKIKHRDNVLEGIKKDKFLGVYLKCGSMNSYRFSGKGFSNEIWSTVFAYSFDVFILQNMLEILSELMTLDDRLVEEKSACKDVTSLFDRWDSPIPTTFSALNDSLSAIQRTIGLSVNNCEFVGALNVEILCSPGKLIYGLPKILEKNSIYFKDIIFNYLFDELENFDEPKQRYIHTLIRDKEGPCSIKVGGRTYGVLTFETLTNGEFNREDHEFELVKLDETLREIGARDYEKFSNDLILKRLEEHGLLTNVEGKVDISDSFEGAYSYNELDNIHDFTSGKNGKTIAKLLNNFRKLEGKKNNVYTFNNKDLENISDLLSFEGKPIFELAAVICFYKGLKKGVDLVQLANTVRQDAEAYLIDKRNTHMDSIINHFKLDIVAQLFNSHSKNQVYAGLDNLLTLSKGYPRHLITIMKYIYQCSIFNGEQPFQGDKVSRKSQSEGVIEASKWFLDEMKIVGANGASLSVAISRIAELYRVNRYSDKPTECSLRAFYTNISESSETTQSLIRHATDWSLLVKDVNGRKDKNSGDKKEKYLLNAMLSPYWGLPLGMRGVIEISSGDLNFIFDLNPSKEFKKFKEKFVAERTFPFYLSSNDASQQVLF